MAKPDVLPQSIFDRMIGLMAERGRYLERLDEAIRRQGIDERRRLFCYSEADTDYRYAGPHHLVHGQPGIRRHWHQCDRKKLREAPVDELGGLYYGHVEQMGYSTGLINRMIQASLLWQEKLVAPEDWQNAPIAQVEAHFIHHAERFHRLIDPLGIVQDILQQKDPVWASPVVTVDPVIYPSVYHPDQDKRVTLAMQDFRGHARSSSGSYNDSSNTVFMHCHQIEIDAVTYEDYAANELFQSYGYQKTPIEDFLGDANSFDIRGGHILCGWHKFREYRPITHYLLHELLHQWNFMCHNAHAVDPDTVEKFTGYTAQDAFLTSVSDMVYPLGNGHEYTKNHLEQQVQTVLGTAYPYSAPKPPSS